MRKLNWVKKAVAVTLLTAVTVTSIPSMEAFALHGTATEIITKDMLSNKAPKDYVINQEMQADAEDGLYSKYFLKEELQTVSVTIDENNFNYLLQNAMDEPYVMTESVTIGDQTIGYAGIKTKGNWTLWATNESASDRFSFTINMGKFIKKKDYGAKQNFYGVDKISFNNMFHDKTAMKEYCAMRLMDEMGIPTPEYGMAKLYVNGDYYGVYFMVEAMDKSILERYFESDDVSDYILKPEGTRFVYDEALNQYKDENGEFTMDSLSSVLYENEDGDYEAAGELLNSAALWEADDDTLQDVAEMLPTVLTWQDKLNLLSAGKDFEGNEIDVNSKKYIELLNEIMDVEETLKYFATHSFIVQQDNMFSNLQNYAFYVGEDGKSMMIPWDYDLGWGTYFDPYDAEGVANNDLDNMYSAYFNGYGDMTAAEVYAQFPLVNVLFQNKKLWGKYYEYMEDCAKIAALGGTTTDGQVYEAGRFAEIIDELAPQLIEAAAEEMPANVFYTNGFVQPRDMAAGLPNLKKLIAMRSVGVWLQKNKVNSIVTGCSADLFTLGNAMTGTYSVSGTLTAVDAETGIFATANYPVEGNIGPVLDVQTVDVTSEIFKNIKTKLGCKNDEDLIVYAMSNTKNPESIYELYIPVSADFETKKTAVYEYNEDILTELKVKTEDNLYKVRTDDISYIVVANNCKPAKKAVVKQDQKESKAKLKHRENTSYIVGNEDCSTVWWTAHSKHYALPDNSVTTIEFENYSSEVDVWDNFVSVFTNEPATYGLEQTIGYYQEYAVVRADNFGWGTAGHTLTYDSSYATLEEFQDILKSAKVTMTITREGSTVSVHEVAVSMEDSAKTYERTVTFVADAEDLYVTLTTEGGYLKVNNVETN